MADHQAEIETLILSDGGLPSMVAAMSLPRVDRAAFWMLPLGVSAMDCPELTMTQVRASAGEAQARALGLHSTQQAPELHWPGMHRRPPMAVVLMFAIESARDRGISKVVWPVAAGETSGKLLEASETAHLIGRLTGLKQNGPNASRSMVPALATPLIDLNPEQVAELALDLNAPLDLVWWRQGGPSLSPDTAKARWMWDEALRSAAAVLDYPLPNM